MTVASVVTEGYGPGASIALVVTSGYAIGIPSSPPADVVPDALLIAHTPLPAFLVGVGPELVALDLPASAPVEIEVVFEAMNKINLPATYRGDTRIISFAIKKVDGTPQSLAGCTLKFGVADADAIGTPYLTKTIGSGIAITSEANGTGTITLDQGDLDHAGEMFYELEIIDGTGASYTYAQGRFKVRETMYPST